MNPLAKKLILGFFLVSIGVLFWVFVQNLFFQDSARITEHFWSLSNIGVFTALLVCYGTFMALAAFFLTERIWAQGILFLGIAPFFLASEVQTYELLGAFAVLWASVFAAREWIAGENASRLSLSIEKVVPRNLSYILTAIAIAVSTAFYVSPAVKQFKDIQIPRSVFQRIVSPFELVFMEQIKAPAQDAGAAQAGRATMPKPVYPFSEPATQSGFYSEFSDAVYVTLNSQISRLSSLPPHTQKLVSLSIALALFGIIRLLMVPARWIIIICSMILFNVLTYTGFVKIGTVQVEKETIEL